MAKRREVKKVDPVDPVVPVGPEVLVVPAELCARVEAAESLPFGERTEIPVVLTTKCSVPLPVGECIAVVTLPPGMTLELLAYAIRHGYAGARE